MKAISLWQPWASLIACGAKPYETRDWAPPRELIGQVIAIHAAKKVDRDAFAIAERVFYGPLHDRLYATSSKASDSLMARFGEAMFPVGCVVCTARLDAAFRLGETATGTAVPAAHVVKRFTSRVMPYCFSVRYDDYGDYSPGRWAWLLTDVQPMNPPIAMKGAQKFFDLPQGWLA